MGSLGLPATAMAVRSAFALLCFALLCGLAASSVGQSETETELTKREGEAAGNKILVEQALESREVRGAGRGTRKNCKNLTGNKKRECQKDRRKVKKRNLKRKGTMKRKGEGNCRKGQEYVKNKCVKRKRNKSSKKTRTGKKL